MKISIGPGNFLTIASPQTGKVLNPAEFDSDKCIFGYWLNRYPAPVVWEISGAVPFGFSE